MSSIELTSSQKTILTALVNLYREQEDAVKGEDIADEVGRNPGTIRNQMQSLKALQLVEGVPGPKGGYKPTAGAYEALELEQMEETASVPLVRNGDPVDDLNVDGIDLTGSLVALVEYSLVFEYLCWCGTRVIDEERSILAVTGVGFSRNFAGFTSTVDVIGRFVPRFHFRIEHVRHDPSTFRVGASSRCYFDGLPLVHHVV